MEIAIDKIRLYYTITGDGPPLLFVHGFPVTGEMWRSTVARLAGVRCIVPDLRGFGRSSVSASMSIARYTDDLVALLDALDERRPAVVCGLSMGGIIALDFFRRYRARLRGLILVDCRANIESPAGKEVREQTAQRALAGNVDAIADELSARLGAPTWPAKDKKHWRDIMAGCNPVGVAAGARALAERPDSLPLLPEIDVPTLIVFGEQDVITPPDIAAHFHREIRGSQLVMVPGAGHFTPVEQPDAFAAAVQQFMDSLGRI